MSRSRKKIPAGLTSKSSAADVNAVQDYLKRFGYLADDSAPDDVTDFGAAAFPLGDGDDAAQSLAG